MNGARFVTVNDMERQHAIEGNVLVQLYMKKAFDEGSAVLLSDLGVTPEQVTRLVKDKRIVLFTSGPVKAHLTGIGDIVAMGECSLQLKKK